MHDQQLLRDSTGTKRFAHLTSGKMPGQKVFVKVKNLFTQPCLKDASKIAVPSSLLAALLKVLDHELQWEFVNQIMPDAIVYSSFTGIMGTLIVFRTVQALVQYREGAGLIYKINGSWLDAASTLLSFTRCSKSNETSVNDFRHTVVRLFSLLNMLCLAELESDGEASEKQAVSFELIDTGSLDSETLRYIKNSKSKVEVVAQMIQCLTVDGLSQGVLNVPPPLLTRVFQDLGNGMMNYYAALNVAHIGIPLPYVTVVECMLAIHAIFTPIAMCTFCNNPVAAAFLTLITLLLPWSFAFLATELSNPFGADENDLPVGELQYDLNAHLHAFLQLAGRPPPSTTMNAVRQGGGVAMVKATTTIHPKQELKYTLSDFFDRVCMQAEQNEASVCKQEEDEEEEEKEVDSDYPVHAHSAIISEVAPVVDDEVPDHTPKGELSNPTANTAGSFGEQMNRRDGPRVRVQEPGHDEMLEHEIALPLYKSCGTHPPAALADLHLEKTSAFDCPGPGLFELATPRTPQSDPSESSLSADVAGSGQDGQCEARCGRI